MITYQGMFVLAGVVGGNVVLGGVHGVMALFSAAQAWILAAVYLAIFFVLGFLFLVAATIRLTIPFTIFPGAQRRVLRRVRPEPKLQLKLPSGAKKSAVKKFFLFLLLCCIPGVPGILIVLGLSYVNVRLIYYSALRVSGVALVDKSLIEVRWRPLLILGVTLLLLIAVPFINLLVPVLMCTSVLNLAYRDNAQRLSASTVMINASPQLSS